MILVSPHTRFDFTNLFSTEPSSFTSIGSLYHWIWYLLLLSSNDLTNTLSTTYGKALRRMSRQSMMSNALDVNVARGTSFWDLT